MPSVSISSIQQLKTSECLTTQAKFVKHYQSFINVTIGSLLHHLSKCWIIVNMGMWETTVVIRPEIVMDSDMNLQKHRKANKKSAIFHQKNISRIKQLMSQQDRETLLCVYFICINYCNSVFTNLPKNCQSESFI